MNLRHLSRREVVSYWGPAIFMLACIALESTDLASAKHTNGLLYFLLRKYFPGHSPGQLWEVNLVIRKAGHIIGYGFLGAAFYRAIRGTLEGELTPRPRTTRFTFAALAVTGTALVASADEIHQMFIPSRTGTFWDVLLDTSAAIVAQILMYLYFRYRARAKAQSAATAAPVNS
jgi:VanZ family protein